MSYNSSLKIALVCSSNVNRSMAAHKIFINSQESPFQSDLIFSYGTGKKVKLPGDNNFEFGTAYVHMLEQLLRKDPKEKDENYKNLVQMLKRNHEVKQAPERFQKKVNKKNRFDIVFTFEERVFSSCVEHLLNLPIEDSGDLSAKPCHVINITIKDSHQDAESGAKICLDLAKQIAASPDWEKDIPKIIKDFENERKKSLLYGVYFV